MKERDITRTQVEMLSKSNTTYSVATLSPHNGHNDDSHVCLHVYAHTLMYLCICIVSLFDFSLIYWSTGCTHFIVYYMWHGRYGGIYCVYVCMSMLVHHIIIQNISWWFQV